MGNNKHYWTKREENALKAQEHYIYMGRTFPNEIVTSINNTKLIDGRTMELCPISFAKYLETSIEVVDMDSVSAIFNYKDYTETMAVLNFASYKNPGGMFLKGSTAQEESLCHASTLYNVLSKFPEYYSYNRKNINKSLYTSRALYSPRIIFGKENMTTCCDVITCAAPNWDSASVYHLVPYHENLLVLFERIRFVLNIAKCMNVDTLILGAYGCGVFGQNPKDVATAFKDHLESERFKYSFKRVIFAIPDSRFNINLNVFKRVFG